MNFSSSLLKSEHIGIREFKNRMSIKMLKSARIITDRGTPVSVNIPYEDLLELIDIIDEITDAKTQALVAEGRKAIKSGAKGVPVEKYLTNKPGKR